MQTIDERFFKLNIIEFTKKYKEEYIRFRKNYKVNGKYIKYYYCTNCMNYNNCSFMGDKQAGCIYSLDFIDNILSRRKEYCSFLLICSVGISI